MVREIEWSFEYVNSRSNTDYKTPDEIIFGAEQLAESILAGEDDVDYLYDNHIMALDLLRAGKIIGPLRSYNMVCASKIWLSRN